MPLKTLNVIQQPQPFDLVGDTIMIAGIGTGFEATFAWRVHEGHDERTGTIMAGDGTGGHGQFQVKADLSGSAFQVDQLFVEIFEYSANDGSEINKVSVPVLYGPLIISGYNAFRRHVVAPGETLTKIAREYYGDAVFIPRITRANPTVISNPNLIFAGQELKIPIAAG